MILVTMPNLDTLMVLEFIVMYHETKAIVPFLFGDSSVVRFVNSFGIFNSLKQQT